MSRMWISFVHDLDPNESNLKEAPYWPRYSTNEPFNYIFRTPDNKGGLAVEPDSWREKQLEWWSEHWGHLSS